MKKVHKIAVINANDDIVEAIQLALTTQGFTTVGAHLIDFKRGRKDFFEFVSEEKPDAIVIDIAPPYDENWHFFKLLKSSIEMIGTPFVVTTTNEKLLRDAIDDQELNIVEVMGKPFDLETIVIKVENAIKQTQYA